MINNKYILPILYIIIHNIFFLSREELRIVLNELGWFPQPQVIEKIMATVDRDENGIISYDEFLYMIKYHHHHNHHHHHNYHENSGPEDRINNNYPNFAYIVKHYYHGVNIIHIVFSLYLVRYHQSGTEHSFSVLHNNIIRYFSRGNMFFYFFYYTAAFFSITTLGLVLSFLICKIPSRSNTTIGSSSSSSSSSNCIVKMMFGSICLAAIIGRLASQYVVNISSTHPIEIHLLGPCYSFPGYSYLHFQKY